MIHRLILAMAACCSIYVGCYIADIATTCVSLELGYYARSCRMDCEKKKIQAWLGESRFLLATNKNTSSTVLFIWFIKGYMKTYILSVLFNNNNLFTYH
jgi:hypothetical protein